jgi:hypothetical protein
MSVALPPRPRSTGEAWSGSAYSCCLRQPGISCAQAALMTSAEMLARGKATALSRFLRNTDTGLRRPEAGQAFAFQRRRFRQFGDCRLQHWHTGCRHSAQASRMRLKRHLLEHPSQSTELLPWLGWRPPARAMSRWLSSLRRGSRCPSYR